MSLTQRLTHAFIYSSVHPLKVYLCPLCVRYSARRLRWKDENHGPSPQGAQSVAKEMDVDTITSGDTGTHAVVCP